jgi:hypothetical protein
MVSGGMFPPAPGRGCVIDGVYSEPGGTWWPVLVCPAEVEEEGLDGFEDGVGNERVNSSRRSACQGA